MHLLLALTLLAVHPATPRRLQASTAEGRLLAESVQATIAATHAALELNRPAAHANVFFAVPREGSWFVYFGWLEKDGSRFSPALVMSAPRGKLAQMHPIDPGAAGPELLAEAKAVALARELGAKASGNPQVDPVLVPSREGLDVYVLQGGPMRDALLLGGDFRFHFDAKATRLISRIQFHKSVIRVPLSDPKLPGGKTVGSYHTHVIDEEPTATDVASAILHPLLTPMLVIGRSGTAYRVDSSGEITLEPRFAATADVPLAAEDGGVVLAPAEALTPSAR